MFGFFKKKPVEFPKFELLETHHLRDKYFLRTMKWDWLNDDMIHLFDHNQPRLITMDPWPQQVYLGADGQKTVKEYIHWMAAQYKSGQIPAELDEVILSSIEDMVEDGGILEIKDTATQLPYHLSLPLSRLDKSKL